MTIANELIRYKPGERPQADIVLSNTSFLINQVFYVSENDSRTTDDDERYLTGSYKSIVDANNITNIFYKTANDEDFVCFCDMMDDVSGADVDTDVWTVDETGGSNVAITGSGSSRGIRLGIGAGNCWIIADQVNGVDLKAADVEFIFNMEGSFQAGEGNLSLFISDGSTDVLVKFWNVLTGTNRNTFRVVVNTSTNTAYFYDDLADTSSASVNLAAISGSSNWYIKFYFAPVGGTQAAIIYGIGFTVGGETCSYRSLSTIDSSNVACVQADVLNDLSATLNISFDNGSNFVSFTNRALVKSADAGTQLAIRGASITLGAVSVGSNDRNILTSEGKDLQVIYD